MKRAIHSSGRVSFGIFQKFLLIARIGHLIVVNRKAPVEAEELFQHGRANERRCIPTLLFEDGGQRRR